MRTTRRSFLNQSVGATTLLASGASLPGFLARTARATTGAAVKDRVFVVVQLSGGNDGLNTVVPFLDDDYHKARPTLAVGRDRTLKLNDSLGLHPEMEGFKGLYDDGLLHVINNVGYPNPDRSHFRSMDIWHTASTEPEGMDDGWIGRLVDGWQATGEGPHALHLDDEELPLALRTTGQDVPSIRSLEAFRLSESSDTLHEALRIARKAASDDLLFVQRTAISSVVNAQRLERVSRDDVSEVSYPSYRLAERLKQIAHLIGAEFGPRVYYTSHGGFDTHAKQGMSHGPLLREFSDSVAAFFADLRERRVADRVVLMTFSEFGRRVRENGSQGTDHGAAAPMFVVGPACRPGLSGGLPDLSRLVDGDVVHRVDFRQVYATLLRNWLGVDVTPILGASYEELSILRPVEGG